MTPIQLRKWTREEYERLIREGVFQEDERLELIEGEVLEMAPQDAPHAATTHLVYEALREVLREGYCLRVQLPLALARDSQLEPDIAVVEGTPRDFLRAHPSTAALVVEVADSSLPFDRERKLPLYARAGIPAVWIVNLRDRCVEVHEKPEAGTYAEHVVQTTSDSVMATVLREPVTVADLLP